MTQIPEMVAAVEKVRAKLAAIEAMRDELADRPAALDEIDARIAQAVAGLRGEAVRALPVGSLIKSSGTAGVVHAALLTAQRDERSLLGPVHLAALLAPDGLAGALRTAAVAALEGRPDGLSAEERAAAVARLGKEERVLLVEEAKLLWAIDTAGGQAPWREGLDAEILLGLTT